MHAQIATTKKSRTTIRTTNTNITAKILTSIIGGGNVTRDEEDVYQIDPWGSEWIGQYTGRIEVAANCVRFFDFFVHTEEALAMLKALVRHLGHDRALDLESVDGDDLEPYRALRLGGHNSTIGGGDSTNIVFFDHFHLQPDEAGLFLEALVNTKREQRRQVWANR
jgi:hypothetical protein